MSYAGVQLSSDRVSGGDKVAKLKYWALLPLNRFSVNENVRYGEFYISTNFISF